VSRFAPGLEKLLIKKIAQKQLEEQGAS